MHLFKKLTYLRGHQHRFCMNYYVDEEALEIREKNIFTATELVTLIAASGNGGVISLFKANEWTTRFYPQYRHRNRESPGTPRSSLLKRTCERLLDNRIGDFLDDYFRKLTARPLEEEGRSWRPSACADAGCHCNATNTSPGLTPRSSSK